MKENGFTMIELMIVLSIIGVIFSLAFSVGCNRPEEGEKVGHVVSLKREGLIEACKTWEGQLIRGGLSDGSGTIGAEPFNFTVESAKLVTQVQELMLRREEVVIEYVTEMAYLPCRSGSNGRFLKSIRPAEVNWVPKEGAE